MLRHRFLWVVVHVLRPFTGARLLTFGLLTLAWRLPADAGTMLVQVEESDQTFRSCLQLHHLCAWLHHTHASLHCRKKKHRSLQRCRDPATKTCSRTSEVRGVPSGHSENQAQTLVCLFLSADTESQSSSQCRDLDQSPDPNRDFSVRNHWAAVHYTCTELLLETAEDGGQWWRADSDSTTGLSPSLVQVHQEKQRKSVVVKLCLQMCTRSYRQ